MKISFITPHLDIRGANRRIIELSNHLITDYNFPTIIYHSDGKSCSWMECLAQTKSLPDCARDTHAVLILTNRKQYDLAKQARAELKLFYVLLLYGNELPAHNSLGIFFKRLVSHKLTRNMDSLFKDPAFIKVANSVGMKSDLHKLGVLSELVVGGINTKMFYPNPKKPNTKPIVLCVGDPLEWKGFDSIKQAFHLVQEAIPQARLQTIYGHNYSQTELARVYSAADVFVDCQTSGGWNNPVVEAMACGTPVVCTNISSVKGVAIHRKTALLTPLNDPYKTASKILSLLQDKKMASTLAENALSHVQQFTWDKTTAALVNVIAKHCYANT